MEEEKPYRGGMQRREDRVTVLGGDISLYLEYGDLDPLQAVTYNLSQSGMAVITGRELSSGTRVWVRGEGIGHGLRRATVQWCRKISTKEYQTGLHFA